jgi:hypothetical protein
MSKSDDLFKDELQLEIGHVNSFYPNITSQPVYLAQDKLHEADIQIEEGPVFSFYPNLSSRISGLY